MGGEFCIETKDNNEMRMHIVWKGQIYIKIVSSNDDCIKWLLPTCFLVGSSTRPSR